MAKFHIKKGDTVYVNAGDDKGKTGRVLEVQVKKHRALVEGINIVWFSGHTVPKKNRGSWKALAEPTGKT